MSPANALPSSSAPRSGRFMTHRGSASKSAGRYRPSPNDFVKSFYAVLNRWRSETAFESDPEKITSHPSFLALVAHAHAVCPLIIEELRANPSMLVWVLDDAFNETPYSEDDVGDFEAMSNGWITWAERNGRAL